MNTIKSAVVLSLLLSACTRTVHDPAGPSEDYVHVSLSCDAPPSAPSGTAYVFIDESANGQSDMITCGDSVEVDPGAYHVSVYRDGPDVAQTDVVWAPRALRVLTWDGMSISDAPRDGAGQAGAGAAAE